MNKIIDFFKGLISTKPSTSKAFSLNLTDLQKLLKNGIYVGIGAAVYYLDEYFKTVGFAEKLGTLAPLVIPFVAGVMDTVVKYVKANFQVKEETPTEIVLEKK